MPEQGGLTDLAGSSPVAAGQPSGVLGQFDVVGRKGEPDPLDLGALLPAAATAGVPIDVILSQGQSITYRVVVTVPGQYIFQEQSSGDPPSVQITGPALDRPLSPTGTNDTLLSPGVYSIRFEAPSSWSYSRPFVLPSLLGPDGVLPGQRRGSRPRAVVAADHIFRRPRSSTIRRDHSYRPLGRFRRSFRHRFPRGPPIPLQDPPPARFVPISRPCEVSRSQGHRPPRPRSWAWEAIWSGAPPSQPLVRKTSQREAVLGTDPGSSPRRGAWSVTQGPPAWSREIPLGVGQSDRRESRGRSGKTACPGNHHRLRSRKGNRDRCWFAAMGHPARGVLSELGRILVRRTTHVRSDQHPRHRADPRAWLRQLRNRIATRSRNSVRMSPTGRVRGPSCSHLPSWSSPWRRSRRPAGTTCSGGSPGEHSERGSAAKTPTPSMAWDRLNVSLLIGSHPRAGSP